MKTRTIAVTSRGLGIHEALDMTETLGVESGLKQEEVLHLRLLAEELFGLLGGIAGDVEAGYWMEISEKDFELHMKSFIEMTREIREQLLSASSSGENEAAKGFMGKLRDMIAVKLLPSEEGPSLLASALMNAAWSSPYGNQVVSAADVWSMKDYRSSLEDKIEESTDAKDAWDELEKSVVVSIADEIQISIVASEVEITVFKSF